MRRYLVITAAVLALLATAFTGTASAAPAAKAPVPHCSPWRFTWMTCTCPPGWNVQLPPLGEPWEWPACVRQPEAPVPHCPPWWHPILGCTCPPGWHVQWPPWWEVWAVMPSDARCVLNKK